MRFRDEDPRLEVQGEQLALYSPFNNEFKDALKEAIPYTSRRFDWDNRAWIVDPQYGPAVRDLVLKHFGIHIKVPVIQVAKAAVTKLLEVRYIGSAKDRGNGDKFAYGWADSAWTVLFPLRVLRDWFEPGNDIEEPTQQSTLYAVLGVKRKVSGKDLRNAYRRAARQWHPDVCREPGATEQFQRLQDAYEKLKDPAKRARYDAGLKIAASIPVSKLPFDAARQWRPPLRCGRLLVEGRNVVGRFNVSRILQWQDILDAESRALVTYWCFGDDAPTERWV